MKRRCFLLPAQLAVAALLVLPAHGDDKKKNKKSPDTSEKRPSVVDQLQEELRRRMGQPPAPTAPVAPSQAVQLRLTNETGFPVELIWLNPNGSQQSYGVVAPTPPGGEPAVIETYSGHRWAFRVNGQVIQTFTASSKRDQSLTLGRSRQTKAPPVVQVPQVIPPRQTPRGGGSGPLPDSTTGNFPPPSGRDSMPAEAQEFLRIHNDARARVGVAPLRWSSQLASYAQQWADQLASTGQFRHRSPSGGFGENLFGGSAGYGPADAARHWLDEKRSYRGGPVTPQNFNAVGHYTQMVWSGTTEVGYGIATGRNGVVVVANYAPAGNRSGESPY